MGSRVIDGVAKKMADDFFGQLADTVSAASDADVETASTAKAPTRERPLVYFGTWLLWGWCIRHSRGCIPGWWPVIGLVLFGAGCTKPVLAAR